MSSVKNVAVLGATGSIGLNTLDVIRRHPEQFRANLLVANKSVDVLFRQVEEFTPRYVFLQDNEARAALREQVRKAGLSTTVLEVEDEVEDVLASSEVDQVMAAIVGAAGLNTTLAAAKAGKTVLLANKESLVVAGALLMDAVKASGAVLLPIDSEHNAIFQCLPGSHGARRADNSVRRILLTASGGPFRGWNKAQLTEVTPEQAVAHPNWSMGKKISVDSATLMNKGLELIEACWLFNVSPEKIEVHIHPESVVHSMVEYIDGSILAQLGAPDMRTPIAYGLGYPERIDAGVSALDLFEVKCLNFERPDHDVFPALRLAANAFEMGGFAPAILNAANEVAVDAFLNGRIRFTEIPELVARALDQVPEGEPDTVESLMRVDALTRQTVSRRISSVLGPGGGQ